MLVYVRGERVELNISASQRLVDALRRMVKVEGFGDTVGCAKCGQCGRGGGFGEEDFGGLFDSIVKVVKKIADNPIVRSIPYAGSVAAGVSAAAAVYQGVRRGHPAAKRRLVRIQQDARRGVPAATQALSQLNAIARGDALRKAAKAGNPAALRRLQAIGTGIAQRDPAAFEAAKVMERLEALERGALAPAREPPIQCPVSMDDMDEEQAAEEVMGAILRRRAMTPGQRQLHAGLSAIAARART